MKNREEKRVSCGGLDEKRRKSDNPKIVYSEPLDYFPKEIRQTYQLGEFAESPLLIKIKSVMLGHAVGDALGVPVEGCSRKVLDEYPVVEMAGYGAYPVPAGSWSDDTSMSLAALDSLAKGKVVYHDIMGNFQSWRYQGKYTPTGKMFDIGGTCRAVIDRVTKEYHWEVERGFWDPDRFDAEVNCGLDDEYSNGNGSLMRIHPFVLYAYAKNLPFEEWMDIIEKASSLTHRHKCSRIGCLIYSFVLMHLLHDPTKGGLKNALARAECHLRDRFEFSRYTRIFTPSFADLPREQIKSSGYIVDTLEAALWCVLNTDSYQECVLKAVNLGQDTDTVAAVAGGLAGALYGYESIPSEWLNTLRKREYIEEICEKANKNWEGL